MEKFAIIVYDKLLEKPKPTNPGLGLLIFYLFFKDEKKIFYTLVLLNFTSIAYYTSQKYFEPLLIVSILVFHQNFLSKNIINTLKNTLVFYIIVFIYFLIATINSGYGLSKLNG